MRLSGEKVCKLRFFFPSKFLPVFGHFQWLGRARALVWIVGKEARRHVDRRLFGLLGEEGRGSLDLWAGEERHAPRCSLSH